MVGEGPSQPPLLARAGSLSLVVAPGVSDAGVPLLLTAHPGHLGLRRVDSEEALAQVLRQA